VVIAAERRGDRVEQLIEKIVKATDDQEAALSPLGLTEVIHGIYRAQTPELRLRRESFLNELLADLTVYPYTKEALLAGKIDGEQFVRRLSDRSHGGYKVLTGNLRDFQRIPGLSVMQL
jgi:predicted nucleic acid-binding protein